MKKFLILLFIPLLFTACNYKSEEVSESDQVSEENTQPVGELDIELSIEPSISLDLSPLEETNTEQVYKRWYRKVKSMYGVGQWHIREFEVLVYPNGDVKIQGLTQGAFGCTNISSIRVSFWNDNSELITIAEFKPMRIGTSEKLFCFSKNIAKLQESFSDIKLCSGMPGASWVVVNKKCGFTYGNCIK
jgi:hypothetical protein